MLPDGVLRRALTDRTKTPTCALEKITDEVEHRPHLLRADNAVQQQQLRELGQTRRVVRRVAVLHSASTDTLMAFVAT